MHTTVLKDGWIAHHNSLPLNYNEEVKLVRQVKDADGEIKILSSITVPYHVFRDFVGCNICQAIIDKAERTEPGQFVEDLIR